MAVASADFRRKKQDKWLEAFHAAPPRVQYQQLDELLNGSAAFLDTEALAYAVTVVCQQLTRCNQLQAQKTLIAQLEQLAPETMEQILPAWALQCFVEALFDGRIDDLPPLLEACLARFELVPDAQWLTMLDTLAFYGQAGLAAQLATELARRLGAEVAEAGHALDEAIVQHLLNHAFELFWAGPGDEKAAKELHRQLKGVCKKSESDYYLRELRQPAQVHLLSMERSLRAEVGDDVLFYGHLAFGRWMLPQGVNLLTSLAMMQYALELWELGPPVPSFKKWVEVGREQLAAYFNELEEAPAADPMSAFVLAWGLPWVYAWLHAQNLCSRRYLAQLQAHCAELQQELIKRRGPCLWAYRFVHGWGCPPDGDRAAFAAQAEGFVATRSQELPLSDNPADSFAVPYIAGDEALLDVDLDQMKARELLALLQRARLVYGDEALGAVLDTLAAGLAPRMD